MNRSLYQAEYRLKNKDKAKAYANMWREKNKEKTKRYIRKFYLGHKQDTLKKNREYRKNSPWCDIGIDIRQRCGNPKNKNYRHYGGRGIKCCITAKDIKILWFRDNAALMRRPSIDRIDNDGNYSVENCRFIEMTENALKASMALKKDSFGRFQPDFTRMGESLS